MYTLMCIMWTYIDVSCVNVIYKYVHMMAMNGTKTFCWQNPIYFLFFITCILGTTCHENNLIHDSMTWKGSGMCDDVAL